MSTIKREPLRKQVRRLLVRQLHTNHLIPGSRLNESDLAKDLNVSRTPLREALLMLTFEGFLQSKPGKGFWVRPVSRREVLELFPVGRTLEILALDSGGLPSSKQRLKLRQVDQQRREHLTSDVDPDVLVRLDNRWHRQLVDKCDNTELLSLLKTVRNRLYRYHRAFAARSDLVRNAIAGHEKIVQALENGDLDAGVQYLREHWDKGREVVVSIIEEAEDEMNA